MKNPSSQNSCREYKLRRPDIAPPGAFSYEQTTGIHHKFERTVQIELLAAAVAEFRQANNLPNSDYDACLHDVDLYQCRRLGNPDTICRCVKGTEKFLPASAAPSPVPVKRSGCGHCGIRIKK